VFNYSGLNGSGTNVTSELSSDNDAEIWRPGELIFSSAGSVTINRGEGASRLRIRGVGDAASRIGIDKQLGSGEVTINAPIVLRLDQEWRNRDTTTDLIIAGNIAPDNHTLTIRGNGDTIIAGRIQAVATPGGGTANGNLVKDGSGTLSLAGINSYTGVTRIDEGVIRIGEAQNLGPGAVILSGGQLNLVANGIALPNQFILDAGTNGVRTQANSSGVISGPITGAGSLTKTGPGSLTLTGGNNYTGGTVVSEGTLVGTTSNIRGNLNISNGATAEFSQSFSAAFGNAITGAGRLVKNGAGTVTLTAANSYTGGTLVSAGTLQGNTLSIQGNVTNNGNVVFDGSGTYSGSMTGSGSLHKVGGSQIVMTGLNSYSGGTIVSGGILHGNSLSIQGNITNNATVLFNETGVGGYAGSMSGSGQVQKIGGGTLILGGTNSYTGGTNVTAGTLQGNTSSIKGNITNNGLVEFNQGGNGTFAGTIGGAGGVRKSGVGSLNISNSQSFTGGTDVVGGTLNLTGSLAGPVSAQGSGTLTGTGAVGGPVLVGPGGTLAGQLEIDGHVSNSGRFAPDFVTGRTTLVNGYTQDSSGQLDVQLTGVQSEQRVTIIGEAELGGTLRIDASQLGPLSEDDQFPILLADSLATNASGQISTFNALEVVGLMNEHPPLNLRYSNNNGLFGTVVAEAGVPVSRATLPGDGNNDLVINEEDITAMATALYDPGAEISFSNGFQIYDLVFAYDIAGREEGHNDGRVDFDDLAFFAELISPTTGSLETSHALIADELERISRQSVVPEPRTLHLTTLASIFALACIRNKSPK